jgi:hypothetical protein
MKTKTFIALLFILLSFSFMNGCNAESESNSYKQSTIILNARQKQILEEMELPTDYDSLNYTQQHAIQRIEVMLSYLEDKYEMNFSYAGYVPAGAMESEHLTAYPTADGTGDGANLVTVKPNGETFKDNYSSKEICKYYERLVTIFVKDYFQSEQAKVVIYGFSTSMETTDEITDDCFHYKAGTSTLVFVSDTICDEKKMSKFAEAMKLWFEEHEIVTLDSRLSLIYDDDVTDITRNNIGDYYTNKKLNLNGDYTIIIYGEEIEQNKIVPNSRGSG